MFAKRFLVELKIVVFGVLVIVAGQAGATGMMSCDAGPADTWQEKDALRLKLEGAGWKVRKVKVDAGCYEVYGTTPAGERVEAYFDPVSLEKLLVARRGQILFRKDDTESAGQDSP